MKTTTRAQRYYAWTVLMGGILLLLYLSARFSQAEVGVHPYGTILLWLAMISVASMSPIPLPRGNGAVHLSTALDFAAMVLFGPLFACWVGVVARLLSNATDGWRPFPAALLRLGQTVLAIGGAGVAYATLGGRFGSDLMIASNQLLPLAGAGFVYLVAGFALTAAWDHLAPARPAAWSRWGRAARSAAIDAVVIPFGLLLALTQIRIGPVGVALFLIPLLLARYVFKLWIDAKRAHVETVRTLISAIDASDPFTWGLSYRISKMSLRVGRQLGLSEAELEELEFAALLHDIGRTAIKRDILLKAGRLTSSEQSILRTHPRVGYELLAHLRFFPGAAEIVYAHHEQPDGKGYPRGLSAREIPMGSRIIMAVAAFDALTSDRPYRRGLSPDAALEELLNHTGSQFFPEAVEALIHLYSKDLLFEEFDDEVLAHYAAGESNSRALEEHFHRRAAGAAVPDKRGAVREEPLAPNLEEAKHAVPVPAEMELEIALDEGGGRLVVAGRSDPGCVRANNEDAFGIFESRVGSRDAARGCLMLVADGMGGAAAGEVASRMALETVRDAYFAGIASAGAREAILAALHKANHRVHASAEADPRYQGMGTTCTALAIAGRDLHLGHVGDSRAYLVRGSSIELLTADHTLAAELAEMGRGPLATPENASHVLTRCLGTYAEVEIDAPERAVTLRPGDAVVLCSDGLSNLVPDEEILEILREATPQAACRRLVELARRRGGPDNITVVVGQVEPE